MTKEDILHNALEKLKQITGLKLKLIENQITEVDGKLQIGVSKNRFKIQMKKQLHTTNVSQIQDQLNKEQRILVSQTISSSARKTLKELGINYLDINGNSFIKNEHGLFIYIEGQKSADKTTKTKYKSFTKNAIKLIYGLLVDEQLINQSYSQMAETLEIAKSTIGYILEDLEEKGFLIKVNEKYKKLTDKQELLNQWVKAFNEKLKPGLLRGKYSFLQEGRQSWKSLDLGNETYWGGEPAADKLNNFLRPAHYTIYTDLTQSDLMNQFKLFPNPQNGEVSVYRIFWNEEHNEFVEGQKQIVNVILVYADLIGTKDNRNFETATKVYERYLSTHFTE